jgi:large subunit ribosomal protein L28
MRRTECCLFSAFAINPETSSPPHGVPRGVINRVVSMGLPPWAAWCYKMNRYALYRMSDISPKGFLPRAPQEMDVIWLNERVRERVRTSRSVQNVYRQLKYPWVKTGIHYSDALDHWVQLPMVEAAMFEVEKDGGFDNFILKRSGQELQSKYGERVRRHILVRQKEFQKNFVLEQQAQRLREAFVGDLKEVESEESFNAVLEKYGVDKDAMLLKLARRMIKGNENQQVDEEPA